MAREVGSIHPQLVEERRVERRGQGLGEGRVGHQEHCCAAGSRE